jgi:excisionase family DNA binding protein
MHTLEREYLSVAEVAMKLGVSAVTIRRKIASGELPATQLGEPPASVRISRRDRDRWLEAHRSTPSGGRAA